MIESGIAKAEDFERIYPIFEEWAFVAGAEFSKEACLEEFQKVIADGLLVYVFDGEKPVAFLCAYCVNQFWAGYKIMAEHLWYVTPSHRGKGLGTLLIRFLEETAKIRGCKAVVVYANRYASDHPETAKKTLEGLDFKLFGYQMIKEVYHGKHDDQQNNDSAPKP